MEFADLTVVWLKTFEAHLSEKGNSINTRAFHFRNIRAVINSAIDEDIVGQEYYLFRKFKITATRKAKESLTHNQMVALVAYTSPIKNRQLARDLLVLSFCLCGINLIDLYNMQELRGGRAVFVRTKTAGRNEDSISLALQPEAQEIINRYQGKHCVLRFATEFPNYTTFNNRMQKQVRALAKELHIENMTYYWMRYTWATFADKLGVAEKEISKALGHTDRSVAGRFYISYDWAKVDAANRKVIDYLTGKAE